MKVYSKVGGKLAMWTAENMTPEGAIYTVQNSGLIDKGAPVFALIAGGKQHQAQQVQEGIGGA